MTNEPTSAACPECGCVGGDECEHLNCPCWTPKNAALEAARRAEGDAAFEYEMALDSRQAVDNNDPTAKEAWFALVAEKSSAWAHAQLRRRRLEAPAFEQLLADPTLQFDRDSAVMRSIADYQNATKGTMDAR